MAVTPASSFVIKNRLSHKICGLVNTLFSCLATISERYSFLALWKPPFISKLAAEDRCHLNGLAMEDGCPRYVTAVSQTDIADGWRDRRQNGGCVIDLLSDEVILGGLSMPHSPRLYQGNLWLLNSGVGDFGYLDQKRAVFEPVTFCPGYMRGLAFSYEVSLLTARQYKSGFELGASQCKSKRKSD